MNPFGSPSPSSSETAWEKGLSTAKKVVKPVFKQTKQVAQVATQQIMGTSLRTDPVSDFSKNNPRETSPDKPASQPTSQQHTQSGALSPQYQGGHMSQTDMKLSQTRAQLAQFHKSNYYDPTFNRPKSKEQPVAEKLEQEKKQEMVDLQQKEQKKKKDDMALKMSTHKAEMFRGAAG